MQMRTIHLCAVVILLSSFVYADNWPRYLEAVDAGMERFHSDCLA